MNARTAFGRRPRQRGVAALIVVMVLFFIVSLVAAYTNRNLIFEQRTSANLSRATQSFEAAQAGIDWAVAMVNGGRIDDSCAPSANAGDLTFRQRYLSIDSATGIVTPLDIPGVGGGRLSAACVFNGASWDCSCPSGADPTPAVPAGDGFFPAFRVRFTVPTGWPTGTPVGGVIRLEAVACPRWEFGAGSCLDYGNTLGAEGRQFISVLLSLNTAVKTTPAAALTARQSIDVSSGATMTAYNSNLASGAIAVQTGGSLIGGLAVNGAAGAPRRAALAENDTSLSGLIALPPVLGTVQDRMFSTVFGLAPDDYRLQPAGFALTGCPCTAAQLRTAIQMNPGRPIWVAGDLVLDTAGTIGSSAQPVVLVVDGSVTATAANTVYGVVYSRSNPWTISGDIRFEGAAIAENGLQGGGSSTFIYDAELLQRARVTNGSFVTIPSSWRDFVQ